MNILYYNEPKSAENGPANVALYLTKALGRKADVTYFPRMDTPNDVINLFNVYKQYLLNKFDIIHFNLVPVLINGSYLLLNSAKHNGTPAVLNIHGLVYLEHALEPAQRPLSRLGLMTLLKSCNLVDKIIVNTRFMYRDVNALYNVAPEKIAVIPNGVDIKEFSECCGRLELEGDPAILNISNFSMLKGFDVLLEAISKLHFELPSLKLHLVGYMPDKSFGLVRKAGIEDCVIFHGQVKHSMIPAYLKSADICVLASRIESFGITLIEAMASGIPTVASRIEAFQEIVSDGKDGVLFKNRDPDDLSRAILTLYRDSKLRKKISYNAFRTAAKYDWDNIATKYISIYEDLCH